MHPESIFTATRSFAAAVVVRDERLLWGAAARGFVEAAAVDTAARVEALLGCTTGLIDRLDAESLLSAARAAGVRQVVTPYAPVGPVADALARLTLALADEDVALVQVRRCWDDQMWPHATKGFFPFKTQTMPLLSKSGLT